MSKPTLTILQSPEDMKVMNFNSHRTSIFLAGGISNCPNWQLEFIAGYEAIRPSHRGGPTVLVNPRREGDLSKEGDEARQQIRWERNYLMACSHIIFWFPKESVCPITLFELGQWATSKNLKEGKVIVGADPDYSRFFDIKTQLSLLVDGDYKISTTMFDLIVQTLRRTVG